MDVRKPGRKSVTDGSSLVSLLLLVVVLGGLTATAIVGVNSMTGSGNTIGTIGTTGTNAGSNTGTSAATTTGNAIGAGLAAAAVAACNASAEAVRAASAVFYVNSGGSYPAKWSDLMTGSSPLFVPTTAVVINAGNPAELDGRGWKMMLTGGGTTMAAFTCSPRVTATP